MGVKEAPDGVFGSREIGVKTVEDGRIGQKKWEMGEKKMSWSKKGRNIERIKSR